MKGTLERGFKSWAERTATSLRGDLGLSLHDLLRPSALAEYLEVVLWKPRDVPGLPADVLDQLTRIDPSGWSAVSVVQDGTAVIIYNPVHSLGRQSSDIVHELAHLILDHEPAKLIMSHDGSFVMRSYDQKHEDEANWLAWSLLLPREGLLACRRQNLGVAEIAEKFGVSESLVNFRLRMTGVEAYLKAASRYRRRG
jgi:Zn-dependent peptidase ImmA (M78 family)